MKKTLLSILTILCLCSLSGYATDTSSTTNSTTKSNVEKMGQPPQDGRINDKPAQDKPDQKLDKKPNQKPTQKPDKKPNKKPDSKPGGDRVPPEFQSSK